MAPLQGLLLLRLAKPISLIQLYALTPTTCLSIFNNPTPFSAVCSYPAFLFAVYKKHAELPASHLTLAVSVPVSSLFPCYLLRAESPGSQALLTLWLLLGYPHPVL